LGGFILALGYKLGIAGGRESAFSANLFQQTPGDPHFGDLLGMSEFAISDRDDGVSTRNGKNTELRIFSGFCDDPFQLTSHFQGLGQ
jgi:hypothetical protein